MVFWSLTFFGHFLTFDQITLKRNISSLKYAGIKISKLFNIYDEWAFQWYQTLVPNILSWYTSIDMFQNFSIFGVPQKCILSIISDTKPPTFNKKTHLVTSHYVSTIWNWQFHLVFVLPSTRYTRTKHPHYIIKYDNMIEKLAQTWTNWKMIRLFDDLPLILMA